MYDKRAASLEKYELTVNDISRGRGTFICDTSQGEKLLVPFKGTKSRAMFIKKYLDALNESGFGAEKIMLTTEGEALSDDGEEYYLLKDYIKGNECRAQVEEDTLSAMENIARFHKVSDAVALEGSDNPALSYSDKAKKHMNE